MRNLGRALGFLAALSVGATPALMSSCGSKGMGHYMTASKAVGVGTDGNDRVGVGGRFAVLAMGGGGGGGGGGGPGGGGSSASGGPGGNRDHQGAKVPTRSQSGGAGGKQGKYGRE